MSSYCYNALGQSNHLLTPHLEYKRLVESEFDRQAAYRQLFKVQIPEMTLAVIRKATNKAWVLGSDRFKERMKQELNRPVQAAGHGGDRKSKAYHPGFQRL